MQAPIIVCLTGYADKSQGKPRLYTEDRKQFIFLAGIHPLNLTQGEKMTIKGTLDVFGTVPVLKLISFTTLPV